MKSHDRLPERFDRYVDVENGLVSRDIFSDDQIFETELKRIFSRCWLYLAHESELANAGDYVQVHMGSESVILVRGSDNKIRAFLNSCRHRGNSLVRADRGNARNFVCTYHGWSYSNLGAVAGIPGLKDFYHDDFNKEEWGLVPVAQIDSYKGLIFGTFDPAAPSLESYLGDMRWGLDMLLDQGDLVAVPGISRWQMQCNWKFAADNAIGDFYHGGWTHLSARRAGHAGGDGATRATRSLTRTNPGFTLVTPFGHGCNADYLDTSSFDFSSPNAQWRSRPEVVKRLGPIRAQVHRANMNVFPNLFVNSGSRELMLRNPLAPDRIEIFKTILVDRNDSEAVRAAQVRASNRHFGPAGMFEQDDGENWSQSTLGAAGLESRKYPLHYAMAIRHDNPVRYEDTPVLLGSLVNEHAQLWMYRSWANYMDSDSWDAIWQSERQAMEKISDASGE